MQTKTSKDKFNLKNQYKNNFSLKVFKDSIAGLQKDFLKMTEQNNLMTKYFNFDSKIKPEKGVTHCAVTILISCKNGNIKIKDGSSNQFINKESSSNVTMLRQQCPAYSQIDEIGLSELKEPVLEILYLKRTPNPKDRYSGNVCFPGGHQDANESLFDTSIRETQEETGINLKQNEKFRFLGNLNSINCFITRSGNIGKVTPFVFLHLEPSRNLKLKLQMKEVCDYFWFPFTQLVWQINNLEEDPEKPYFYLSKPKSWVTIFQYSLVLKKEWMILKGMTMGFSRKLIYKAIKYKDNKNKENIGTTLTSDEKQILKDKITQMNGNYYNFFGFSKFKLTASFFGYSDANETEHDLYVFLTFCKKVKILVMVLFIFAIFISSLVYLRN
jgi:8-oxo-dGTP pyrophosphatase MutT (NUDIX family)